MEGVELKQNLYEHFDLPKLEQLSPLNRWLLIFTLAFLILSATIVPHAVGVKCPPASWPTHNWCMYKIGQRSK